MYNENVILLNKWYLITNFKILRKHWFGYYNYFINGYKIK